MTAERMQLGVYLNNGVSATNVMRITMAMTMLDMAVYTPAWKFTADLENDPATSIHQLQNT